MIRHVVSWKLAATDPAEKEAAFTALAEGFGALPHVIPEIKALWIGKDLDETEGNWDVVLIIDAATSDDLASYQAHPEHVKVANVVRSVATERSAVDFEL